MAFAVVLNDWRYPAPPKTMTILGINPGKIYKPHTPNDQLRFAFSLDGSGNKRQSHKIIDGLYKLRAMPYQ